MTNGAAEKGVQEYMGQGRAMKIGLGARLKCKVESDWKVMERITELAGDLLSRGQVERMAAQRPSDCTAGTAPTLSWRSASR